MEVDVGSYLGAAAATIKSRIAGKRDSGGPEINVDKSSGALILIRGWCDSRAPREDRMTGTNEVVIGYNDSWAPANMVMVR